MPMMNGQIQIRRLRRQHGTVLMCLPKQILERFDLGPGDFVVLSLEEIPGATVMRSAKEHYAKNRDRKQSADEDDSAREVCEPAGQ